MNSITRKFRRVKHFAARNFSCIIYIMKLSEELLWRGFVKDMTFSDVKQLDEQKWTLYLGTDPSADSLHVGHLAVYMMVRRFLDHGHKVILLIGGGTGMVGDPRDTTERELQPLDEIAKNATALTQQVAKLFGGQEFVPVNNYDWLKDVKLLEFLRDTGKHFAMGMLVEREHFKARVGEGKSGMSFAEFTYTLLQGYDFWHLFKNYDVNLQIGGSDQWGNLLSGVDLIRKKENAEVHAMAAPLVINRSTGRKFGKTEEGTVWLDPSKTSPYRFYQFWLNVDDESAIDYLKLFTLLNEEEVNALAENHFENPSERAAQKTLAHEVTDLVHGRETTESVERVTRVLFGGADFADLTDEDLSALAREIPAIELHDDLTIVSALTDSKVASSGSEALRLIKQNAISVNGQKIVKDQTLTEKSLIKKGKNQFVLVR